MRFVEKNQKPEFFNGEFVDVHEKALFVRRMECYGS
jgi:hypothetical protein